MLVPRALWRPVGAAVGRAAPGPMRAYYRAVTRSYLTSLRRTPGIRALYMYSSFVGGNFRPGRSDVDFVAVTEAPTAESEVDLLLRLRRPYRRHQGFLPIDVWTIPEAEFADTAAWVTAMRPRAAEERPTRAVSEWRLIAGDDLRSSDVRQPDPRVAVIGDYFVRRAIEFVATRHRPAIKLAHYLAELERDVEREGLTGSALDALRVSRAQLARGTSRATVIETAIHATLGLVDEHRRRHTLPRTEDLSPGDDWAVPAAPEDAVAAARRLLNTLDRRAKDAIRSVTIYTRPFELQHVLLLESEESDTALPLIRWAVGGGAAKAAHRTGLAVHILSSGLAEDSWRSGPACYALVGGGRLLFGDALAARIRAPARRWQSELWHYGGFWGATSVRWTLLGHRSHRREDAWPFRIAAERELAAGGPPVLDPASLMARIPELRPLGRDPASVGSLDDRAWARLALEIWRGWPPVGEHP